MPVIATAVAVRTHHLCRDVAGNVSTMVLMQFKSLDAIYRGRVGIAHPTTLLEPSAFLRSARYQLRQNHPQFTQGALDVQHQQSLLRRFRRQNQKDGIFSTTGKDTQTLITLNINTVNSTAN